MIFACLCEGREGFIYVRSGFIVERFKRGDRLGDIIAAIELVEKFRLIANVI